ncbi:hypothetical protein BURKHO8Y_50008 [Burkholderia sp. 8Y]|nr:hypothetical protein BURKHO8Y_50008 [Burkholderia sp. 8Y]
MHNNSTRHEATLGYEFRTGRRASLGSRPTAMAGSERFRTQHDDPVLGLRVTHFVMSHRRESAKAGDCVNRWVFHRGQDYETTLALEDDAVGSK